MVARLVADGKLIAFYASELYLMRPDGHGVRQLTEVEGEYPSWAPDGSRLAFMSAQPGARGRNPDYDVFVVNVDGSGLKKLTDWGGEDGWPSWSPDGRWIAFSTSHRETDEAPGRSIYLMRPDGSASTDSRCRCPPASRSGRPTGGRSCSPRSGPGTRERAVMGRAPRRHRLATHPHAKAASQHGSILASCHGALEIDTRIREGRSMRPAACSPRKEPT